MELENLNDAVKKRDLKEKSAAKEKYRITKKLSMFVGDDTGLLKKVALMYNYQTDTFGDQ
jgi:hypothetical protein